MYRPKNFPGEFEENLLSLLGKLAIKFKQQKPANQAGFTRLLKTIIREWKKNPFGRSFPKLWWLNYVLNENKKSFDPEFVMQIKPFLIKNKIRSLSGVVTVSVFTKGKGCSYRCVYCPTQPEIPKSYLADEPAVLRAISFNYDPYEQTRKRLIALELSNHPIDKVEIIIKGGSFSAFEKSYREQFVKEILAAANNQPKDTQKSLIRLQRENETAASRIIGINIETRPDYIDNKEILFLRKLGVTQVELGVQILDEKILEIISRGHGVKEVKKATKLLKNAGFKVAYHLMPNLPGSSVENDYKAIKRAFERDFRPDYLKIYPTVITKYSELENWYQIGKYRPYSTEKLIDLLVKVKAEVIPPYVRIGRLGRDITEAMMVGAKIPSHIRQLVQQKLKEKGLLCRCIRCREIKNQMIVGQVKLHKISYSASGGREYFLEYIDRQQHLLGFLRFRISSSGESLIREVHVYGQAAKIGEVDNHNIQHHHWGRKLIEEAEKMAKKENVKQIKIISGVGVRAYYRKFGYRLSKTYMIKDL